MTITFNRTIFVGTEPGNNPPNKSQTIKRITKWSIEAGVQNWTWTNLSDPEHMIKIQGYRVIAMGNVVAKYFEKNNVEHLKVPHPSGLNRMWNDPKLEPQVIKQIRGFTSQ